MLVKWCVLGEGLLKWFNEDTSLARPKEIMPFMRIMPYMRRSERKALAHPNYK